MSPEGEANELHHQPVGRGIAWTLFLFFLLLITVRPLVLLRNPDERAVFTLFFKDIGKAFAEGNGPREINRGLRLAIGEFDQDIEKNSRFSERLRPLWQRSMAALGTGHETVHVGKGGWLEYRPAFDYVTGPPIFGEARLRQWKDADPRPALLRLAADLRKRNIALWVMAAPSKVMVEPESFAPELAGRAEEIDNPSWPQLRRELEAAGIRVFDPLPGLRRLAQERPAYFKTDSHWNAEGLDVTAGGLAAALEGALPLSPRSRDWRRSFQTVEHQGDLIPMLHLEGSSLFPPEPARLAVVTDAKGRIWKSEPGAEVMLLGDSFANLFAARGAGLPAQLAYHLGRPVDRIAIDGGGPIGTRQQLDRELRQDPARIAGAKVLVLEFAARELVIGSWPVIAMPEP
jgi:hypothetical protein